MKIGKLIPAIAGGIIGGVVGGPAGATAGFTIGAGLTAAHGQERAASTAKHELSQQTEAIRGQAIKADKIAKEQQMHAEKVAQKISAGRVRSASRRVRGGLFGDSSNQQNYSLAPRLGA